VIGKTKSNVPETLTYPIRSDKFAHQVQVARVVHSEKTDFQQVDVVETECFGRMLLLDNHIQLATRDEHAYHEALVHVPLLSVPNPRRALVIGGGDGGVVRELVRHKTLEEITMVEIDEGVVRICREHLPSLNANAYDDSRVNLVIGDAFPFVKNNTAEYDLIVVDATDTYEEEDGELSEMLFTADFYRDCLNSLSPGGFVVTQADNPVFCPYSLDEIQQAFQAVFPRVGSYWGLVPSFGGYSAYCWASRGNSLRPELPPASADLGLRYLDGDTYRLGLADLPF
jgi:spermidine synthase